MVTQDPSPLLIVGAGAMAQAYSAVLADLAWPHTAVSRSPSSAERFRAATGVDCQRGGLAALLGKAGAPSVAIVAAPVADLAECGQALIAAGCKKILIEKPGGASPAEITRLARAAANAKVAVFVAYNRRFYASVRKLRTLAAEDGGITSFTFEFTEVADTVAKLPYPAEVLANWELANSTHVIDTAFFIAGAPRHVHGVVAGALPWHPRCARFAGHGVTEAGASFSYSADWDAPGRWGIEINTRLRRLVLRPMEKLHIQKRGSFSLDAVEIDDDLDRRFKPGLHRQTAAFLLDEGREDLADIAWHEQAIAFVAKHIMCEDTTA